MKKGQASKTAQWVCMGRAMADGGDFGISFQDPTARNFLPPDQQATVDAFFKAKKDPSLRTFRYRLWQVGAQMMLVRTAVLDRALIESKNKQVVILGAGYDGRAWRLPELSESTVFEVDHPDTQASKRAQIGSMKPKAHDLRFVPVDFTQDDLSTKLREAGHDPSQPTTWIWEGVVMYLTEEQIRATLTTVQKLSAQGSTLVILYHEGSPLTWLLKIRTRMVGEPLKSTQNPEQMKSLLREYGFTVEYDNNMPGFAEKMSPELAKQVKRVSHLRAVVAKK